MVYTRKKTIVVSIIGMILFLIGIALFLLSFTVKRSSIIFVNDDGSVIKVVPTAVGDVRVLDVPFQSSNQNIQRGYENKFIGWEIPGESGYQMKVEMKENKDITVVAQYKIVKSLYKISYAPGTSGRFSSVEEDKKVLNFDIDTESFELPRPISTSNYNGNDDKKYGYTFAGWDIKETPEEERLFEFEKAAYISNLSLIAKWEANEYGIIIDEDTKKLISESELLYGYHSAYGVDALPNPKKTGYKFLGWYDNPEFNGEQIKSIAKGSTGDITLYPKWEVVNYTITYNLVDGEFEEGATIVTEYNINDDTFTLPVPVKEGYTFIGWRNDKGVSNDKLTEIKKGTTGNLVLIAIYEKIEDEANS